MRTRKLNWIDALEVELARLWIIGLLAGTVDFPLYPAGADDVVTKLSRAGGGQ